MEGVELGTSSTHVTLPPGYVEQGTICSWIPLTSTVGPLSTQFCSCAWRLVLLLPCVPISWPWSMTLSVVLSPQVRLPLPTYFTDSWHEHVWVSWVTKILRIEFSFTSLLWVCTDVYNTWSYYEEGVKCTPSLWLYSFTSILTSQGTHTIAPVMWITNVLLSYTIAHKGREKKMLHDVLQKNKRIILWYSCRPKNLSQIDWNKEHAMINTFLPYIQ